MNRDEGGYKLSHVWDYFLAAKAPPRSATYSGEKQYSSQEEDMYMARSEALFRAATLTLLFFVVRSAGKWTADPSFARDSIRLTWDDTGVDDSFVKYVVQMHQVNGTIGN
ncbi:Hypp2295, partial [Branchiostoma lanceolatum]